MTRPPGKALVKVVLDEYGRTFSSELGFDVSKNTPSPLFRLLCFALLSSARISGAIAFKATQALADQGWTAPRKMADSTWRQRTDTLNKSGYARYDESTSRMLGDTCQLLLDKYGGDLRRLRDEANRDPDTERALLKECKGIGDVGANIFFREVQHVWDEHYPFADTRALRAAEMLGLGKNAAALKKHVSKKDFTRFVAGLVRVDQHKAYDKIRTAARQ